MTTIRARLGRGRPRLDERDQIINEAAEALQLMYGLGPQIARDLAVHFIQRSPDVECGKLQFSDQEVRGVGDAVHRKRLRSRNTMLAALILMSNEAAMARFIRTLLVLDAAGTDKHVRMLIESVANLPHNYRMRQKKKKRIKSK